jgi:hypothetical protein
MDTLRTWGFHQSVRQPTKAGVNGVAASKDICRRRKETDAKPLLPAAAYQ